MTAPLPAWIEELKRDFPELAWEKRGWIAARIDRDVKQWDRYLKGTSVPDSDKIQEFRERLEAHRHVDQMLAERRRTKGHLPASAGSSTTPPHVKDAGAVTAGGEGLAMSDLGDVEHALIWAIRAANHGRASLATAEAAFKDATAAARKRKDSRPRGGLQRNKGSS